MKIAVFHYHFRPGGVTDVIVYSAKALLKNYNQLEELRIVSGEEEGTEELLERIREGLDTGTANKLRLDILEETGYLKEGEVLDPEVIASRLEARYGEDTLWWIHNYHLGKNPYFTKAVTETARSGKRNILFHIHDFPECGRYENLEKLDSVLETPPYPSGPRIRYAVINQRDKKILSEAGLGDSVFLLINPVPQPELPPPNRQGMRKALTEITDAPAQFIKDAPVILYPVRAIRRKNIFEAALMTRVFETPANLIVTLPGVSDQEKEYSEKVEKAYSEGLIKGAWCPESSGKSELSYKNLAVSCDAVISTSVQEGFGYLFLNSLFWQKPLIARYLDILDGVLDIFGDYPRRFWADFRVPAEKDLAEKTINAYLSKIENLKSILPEKSIKTMTATASKLAAGGGIDFSFLSVDDQLKCLKKADSEKWLESTRMLNKELIYSVERTIQAVPLPMHNTILQKYGESAYIKNFSGIVSSFGIKNNSASPVKIRDSVIKAFGRIDYLRLLYG